jgi:flavin-dependent dehydrogenase
VVAWRLLFSSGFPFSLEPAVEQVISEVDFSWCLKDPVVAELPGDAPFWIVRRERLDQLLAEHAVEAGAEHYRGVAVHRVERHGNHWEVSASDGLQWCSRAVVIADGSGSPWPQQLGLGPKHVQMASTMSVRLEGQGRLADGTTRFEFGLVKQGFAWAFPIAGGVNIGVGSFIGKQDADPDAVLSELLPDLGFEASAGIRQRGQLRVWNGHHRLDGDGVVVVGDAASLCDPFLAEGLRPALMSGCEAAHHLTSGSRVSKPICGATAKPCVAAGETPWPGVGASPRCFIAFLVWAINSASNDPPHHNALHKSCRVRWGTATSRRE